MVIWRSPFLCETRYRQESFYVQAYYKFVQLSTLFLIVTSSYHLLTLAVSLGIWGVVIVIFGETIITTLFSACFSYRKDQRVLVFLVVFAESAK